MLSVNLSAGLLVIFCFYKGLLDKNYKKSALILKRVVLIGVSAFCLFMLWGLIFYYLNDVSVYEFNLSDYLSLYRHQMGIKQGILLYLPLIIIVFLGFVFLYEKMAKYLQSSSHTAYGNAHFATKNEIKKMRLLEPHSDGRIIVGEYEGKILSAAITNHILMFAPSRSGKGVSTVIPNALTWKGSMLCTDNKYEVFKYTSGYRKKCGNEVYRFSPASREFKTHCINPLDFINKEDPARRIADLQLILDILIEDAPGDNKMWAEEARSLTTGLLLWLLQSDKPFTLSQLSAMVKGQNLDEFLTKVIDECVIADNLITIDVAAYVAIQNFLQKAEKEQSGVRSTLTGMLRLWEDPLVCAATDKSDFSLRDMRKRPISLYLSFGTSEIDRLSPLINLIIQLFLSAMLDKIPESSEPHKVLCLLDEINRFGRMDKLKDGFGDLAGYGVHLLPIIQNVGQFYATYGGRDESDIFFQNTDYKLCFKQNTATDRELVSSELGTKTVRIKTRSYSSNQTGVSYNESFVERPLLTPSEVGSFSDEHQIIIGPKGPVKCKKIIYYQSEFFKSKLLEEVKIPYQSPSYPTIEINKITPSANDAGLVQENEDKKQREKMQAREIGKSVSKALQPLIQRATHQFESKYLGDENLSTDAFNDLINSFIEDKGACE